MLDTLYDMASEAGDLKMMARACSNKIDYYYYQDNLDSVIYHVNRTKAFAKEHSLPTYYYFAWNRLVYWYLNHRYLELAMNEIQLIQQEALETEDDEAIMQSYQMMGQMYEYSKKRDFALDYYKKAIAIINEKKLDQQYLFYLYNCTAYLNMQKNDFEEAEVEANKGRQYLSGRDQLFQAYLVKARLYLNWGKISQAKKYLDSIKVTGTANATDNRMYRVELMRYDNAIGDTRKALAICEKLISESDNLNELADYYSFKKEFEVALGRNDDALKSMIMFYSLRDSLLKDEFSKEMSEQAIIYELKDINQQKQQLELELRTRWMNILIIALSILLIVFIIGVLEIIKIRNLNVKLKKSEQVKSAFLQNLSHEVRTPLNSIMGFSEMLVTSSDISKDEYNHYLAVIFNNSKLLMKLYSDALVAAGAYVCNEKSLININDCCREAVDMVRKECTSDVELKLDLCEGETTEIVDKNAMSKIILNLLYNSVKFTRKGYISIKTEYLRRNTFCITVTDTGPGIPLDKQDKVFETFYHIDELSQGAGLGLSINKIFADSMKGKLKIDSSYNDGCRISFTFPV